MAVGLVKLWFSGLRTGSPEDPPARLQDIYEHTNNLTFRLDLSKSMDTSSHTALQGCVSSLRSSMQLLDSSINILDSGVSDYPRLGKVLQTTRVRSPCPVHR